MEKDYVPRRNTASAPARRRPVTRGGSNRRKSGPPPIIPIAIILVVLVIVVIVIVSFFGGGKDKNKPATSTAPSTSQASSLPSGTPSGDSSKPATPSSKAPQGSPPPEKNVSGLPTEKLGALLKVGDSGYEYYSFVEDTANKYSSMIAKAATELSGTATLYEMIIPTSMDILLPESVLKDVDTSDQKKAIDYMYKSIVAMNPAVKTVSIFDPLKMHNNDYIYFRTDHHWTQLGAYYAYREFCAAKGITPLELDRFNKKSYEGFLGSFYADDSSLGANPDTVDAYIPPAKVTMSVTQQNGELLTDWPLIQDGSAYDPENLYLIFIGGDQPYEEITNSAITDGSSCVVVKESFGNALVPFLVSHYQHIYVVDYRYYEGNIADLAKEKKATDVLMLNNISMTRNEELVNSLSTHF